MGKRILVRRRGRGTSVFRAPTHRRINEVSYPPLPVGTSETLKGTVEDILHEPARGTPLALIRFEDGERAYVPAPEGLSAQRDVSFGPGANVEIGNIKPINSIPEGTMICNIELRPGDGGKIARASGTYATVVAHTPMGTEVKLPSGKAIYVGDQCRAMIGVVAAAGRTEKPFLKAGAIEALMSSRGRRWPVVKGQAMISASHPYGGGRHKHAGKPTTVSRDTPPGRKVGLIAARQSGRAKKRMRIIA
jgi:large subunit ribosomal protein L2